MHRLVKPAAIATIGLSLGACGLLGQSPPPAAVPAAAPAPVMSQLDVAPPPSGEAIQYFRVPGEGRQALAARLAQLAGDPGTYSNVRVSNAWRTAASAEKTPNDYAACVSAVTTKGQEYWMVVVSGAGTGDAFGGQTGLQRCSDPTRVTSWEPLS